MKIAETITARLINIYAERALQADNDDDYQLYLDCLTTLGAYSRASYIMQLRGEHI